MFKWLFGETVDNIVKEFENVARRLDSAVALHHGKYVYHSEAAGKHIDNAKAAKDEANRAAAVASKVRSLIS